MTIKPPIRYYFFIENYKHEWQKIGLNCGYNTARQCIKDNIISIQFAEKNKLYWKYEQ